MAKGEVRTRNPGTNAFLIPQNSDPNAIMTFSADGTVSNGFKKRPGSQKRAFQKVETRDLAGKWCGVCSYPMVFPSGPFSFSIFCTTKRALNEDQYEESGHKCVFFMIPSPAKPETRTRKYVNGHPTNGFAKDAEIHWHRDPGCAGGGPCDCLFFAKKVG